MSVLTEETHTLKKKEKEKKNIEVWGLKLLQTQSTAAKTGLMLLFTKQMFAEYVKKKNKKNVFLLQEIVS